MNLIVGLGNPGERYRRTRHNIGFQVIDLWSKKLGVRLSGRSFQSRNSKTWIHGKYVMLFCPATFMNRSGQAIKACVEYHGLETSSILVVHDDLDMPVGRIKVATHGGSGGHRGVASVIRHLGSPMFPRIRVGIGRPRFGEIVEDYVLKPFYKDQLETMEKVLEVAVRGCELFVSEGVESAMNKINCRNILN